MALQMSISPHRLYYAEPVPQHNLGKGFSDTLGNMKLLMQTKKVLRKKLRKFALQLYICLLSSSTCAFCSAFSPHLASRCPALNVQEISEHATCLKYNAVASQVGWLGVGLLVTGGCSAVTPTRGQVPKSASNKDGGGALRFRPRCPTAAIAAD